MTQKALWSGRFKEGMNQQTLAFTSSLAVDSRLAWFDIVGSVAHARMLGRQGILPQEEVDLILSGLKGILGQLEDGEFAFDETLEDVHTNIEVALTDIIGEAGGRLHTARSRNDQVATDMRMYVRQLLLEICAYLLALQRSLAKRAEAVQDVFLPGFTHTQHAQPVTLAHHLLAHAHRFSRDAARLLDCYQRVNICPLGSAALAGTTYDIDRRYVAEMLGFDGPCPNSMDGVSDRDFAAEFVFDCSLAMVHLSSLCEEIVLWSSSEFGFVQVDDKYATGSSIMPQKKNPDVAELVRGRSSLTLGDLVSMLALLRSLPLTYNRDLQEDKGIVFRAADTLASCLDICVRMVATLGFEAERMLSATEEGYLNATELADYLVTRGMPFRKAHEITGKAVRRALDSGRRLEELSFEELRDLCDKFDEDVYDALKVQACVARRESYGGTSPKAVRQQLEDFAASMDAQERDVAKIKGKLQSTFEALLSS